jgi:hypothetical protein
MSTLVTRAGKGSPLTHNEVDANFNNLNTDKIQSGNTVAALTVTSATVVDLAVTGITSFDGSQGTAGQVLTSAGTGNTPTWATANSLPSQTGNSGKYLTTDGSAASWGAVTGSGNVVLATSPTLVTPALGTPSAIVLTNATGLGYGAMPAGSVLQIVQYSTETAVSTTSSSFTDVTNFTATITPKFSTSKILVLTTLNGIYHTAVANQAASFRMLRGASQIAVTLNVSYSNTSIDWQSSSTCLNYLDSPATTSATTYKLQWYSRLGNTVQLSGTQDTSTLILMEIAG